VAVYLVIGAAIGSVTPNLLASLTANRNGKRSAILNLIFNVCRAILMVIIINITPLLSWIQSLSPNDIGRQIANTHTCFAILAVLLILPFTQNIINLTYKIIPELPEETRASEDRQLIFMNQMRNVPPNMAIHQAQLEAAGSAKAIMVLDDVCGFFSPDDFTSLCLPYMKEVFNAFPEMTHFFHNDYTSDCCYPHLEEMGVDAFNFTHKVDITKARELVGKKPVLMGNVPPMILTQNDSKAVYDTTMKMIQDYVKANGSHHGLLVSTGGGLPMGAKQENIDALICAVRDFNATL